MNEAILESLRAIAPDTVDESEGAPVVFTSLDRLGDTWTLWYEYDLAGARTPQSVTFRCDPDDARAVVARAIDAVGRQIGVDCLGLAEDDVDEDDLDD